MLHGGVSDPISRDNDHLYLVAKIDGRLPHIELLSELIRERC